MNLSKTKAIDIAQLDAELHQSVQKLEELKQAQSALHTKEYIIDQLFQACNRFADQFEQLEKQNTDISQLENQYITLLMDLTEYDTQIHSAPLKITV